MNQEKIGKFIAKCRRKQNLTQEQLAEKLNITYKAVSKWECGKGLPDASLMIDLCNILKISVNDLLSGEIVSEESYNDKVDENLIKVVKEKEAMIKSARYGYGIAMVLLIIYNFFTVKDPSKILDSPEFIIMSTSTFIYFFIYFYFLNKKK